MGPFSRGNLGPFSRGNNTVERIHQEDFCQATGTPPRNKYQEDGGPSLRQIAQILRAVDPEGLIELLRQVTLHVVVGNGDAHAKNVSLLHDQSGALHLAPLYDVMSTLYYGDERLAMSIDKVQRITRVALPRLINEAASWGLAPSRSAEIVNEILRGVPEAVKRAQEETPGLPDEIQNIVAAQRDMLLDKGDRD